MLIDYNKFEIINLGGYQIDHASNKKLLETLEDFYKIAINSKLNYYLSGSVCLSLLTNKVYRTWKDIDILIDEDVMPEWLDLFPRDKWFYFNFDQRLIKVYHHYNNNYIELNTGDPRTKEYYQKYLKKTSYNGITIGDLNTLLYWKKNFRQTKKRTDFYDEILAKKYLDNQ
jgi:hypothetical protein